MKANSKDRLKVFLFVLPFFLLVSYLAYIKFAPKQLISADYNRIELLDKDNKDESDKLVSWKRNYANKIQDGNNYYIRIFLYNQPKDNYIEEEYDLKEETYKELVNDNSYIIKVKYTKEVKNAKSLGYVYDVLKSN